MAACRKKSVLGVSVTSADQRVWTWQIGERRWTWCPAGQTRVHEPDGTELLSLWSPKLEGAVGYSMGWEDGWLAAVRKLATDG